MCGIWLEVGVDEHDGSSPNKNLVRRGPDHVGTITCQCTSGVHSVQLQASVLKMRSQSALQPVPIHSSSSSLQLAWNGELYQMLNGDNNELETVAGYDVSDTQLVAHRLVEASDRLFQRYSDDTNNEKFLEEFADALANQVMGRLVNAEYAFCLVTPWAIYYGRDPWGRRSLLYWCDPTGIKGDEPTQGNPPYLWKLLSVCEDESDQSFIDPQRVWTEVPPGLVHEYRFQSRQFHSTPISTLAWNRPPVNLNTIPEPPDNASLSMWKASFELEHYLRQAVQLRVCGTANDNNPPPIPIAVLFSGGIDSVVLAALALQVLPSTESLKLWNVSFVDQHTGAPTTAQDCRAAQASYEELLQLFPKHKIVLETTEVSWEEMTESEAHIRTLIQPKSTTMDLNIGTALWFASKDRRIADLDDNPRILLVGMGADEQLGGYGRHRKAFQRALESGDSPNECLRQELDLDIDRLWERNLGRDDRIFSDHGKEARFPYLDHHVTNFLAQTHLDDVCDYSLPPGEGDKRILRLLAMRLGLETASGMVKRAIQFGSRISHVSDKRRFGSRRKAKGTSEV